MLRSLKRASMDAHARLLARRVANAPATTHAQAVGLASLVIPASLKAGQHDSSAVIGWWTAAPKQNRAHSTSASASPAGVHDSHELVKWVQASGGEVAPSVRVINADPSLGGGWGLAAVSDVAPGQQLIHLPAKCHLTYSSDDDPRLLAVIEQVPTELWGAKLALQLLAHRVRGDDSPFAAYIRNLPTGVAGIPMFFPKDAMDAIEYPPVKEQVKKRCRWLYDFSRIVLAALPNTPRADPFNGTPVDINALGWALACVTSRAFRTRGPAHPAALLPLIDMANHSFEGANCEVKPAGDGSVALVAQKQIAAGEPLLISYGALSNDFLLMDYGFLVEGNPHDRVALRFDVGLLQTGAMIANVVLGSEGLGEGEWKRTWLQQLGLAGQGSTLEVTFGGPDLVDPRLVAAARVLAATQPQQLEGVSAQALGALGASPLGVANEVAAVRTLSGVAAVALSQFSTSLDADAQLLQRQQQQQEGEAAGVSGDMQLAVRLRAGKKRILSAAIRGMAEQLQRTVAAARAAQAATQPSNTA